MKQPSFRHPDQIEAGFAIRFAHIFPLDSENIGNSKACHFKRDTMTQHIAGRLGIVLLKIVILHNIRATRKK
jgi:hypothetical protein